jgi:hypothetical protein
VRLVHREPSGVGAIAHGGVDAGIQLVDLGAVLRRIEIVQRPRGECIEGAPEHPYDLRRLVVDDRPFALVPGEPGR